MKKILVVVILMMVLGGVGYGIFWWKWPVLSPRGDEGREKVGYLVKYDFDSLRRRGGQVSRLAVGGDLAGVEKRREDEIDFDSQKFSFMSEGKRITGMINSAKQNLAVRKYPAIIMVRGYADKWGYYTGSGTWRVADKLAEVGIVTVSIDFLGFGGSDGESEDMLEARFEKVPAVMDLIASVKVLDFVDGDRVGIWAHSNGGQIALSVVEILGDDIPTVLWAPMTNPFPQSVLDTASDLDDGGRLVIEAIEEFERNYDSRRYAFENYYDWMNASVLINQGTADYWCQVEWQEAVVEDLLKKGKMAELRIWSGDDHNLSRNWEKVVEQDILFWERGWK